MNISGINTRILDSICHIKIKCSIHASIRNAIELINSLEIFAIHKPKRKKQIKNNETINKQLATTRVEYILLRIALCALAKWKSTLCVRVVSMGGHWPIMIERLIRSWKFVVRVRQKQRDEWIEINNNNEKHNKNTHRPKLANEQREKKLLLFFFLA